MRIVDRFAAVSRLRMGPASCLAVTTIEAVGCEAHSEIMPVGGVYAFKHTFGPAQRIARTDTECDGAFVLTETGLRMFFGRKGFACGLLDGLGIRQLLEAFDNSDFDARTVLFPPPAHIERLTAPALGEEPRLVLSDALPDRTSLLR